MRLTDYQRGSIFGLTLAAVAFAFALSMTPNDKAAGQQTGSKTAAHAEQQRESYVAKWWRWTVSGDSSGFYTFGLIFVGVAQAGFFIWQLDLINRGLKLSGRQVDAYIASEEPLLRVSNYAIGGMGLTNRDETFKIPDLPAFVFEVTNVGKGYAEPVRYRCGIALSKIVPTTAAYEEGMPIRPDTILLNGEKTTLEFWFDLNGDQRKRMLKATENLWVFCIVSFLDQFGRARDYSFCVRTIIDINQDKTMFRFGRNKAPEPEN